MISHPTSSSLLLRVVLCLALCYAVQPLSAQRIGLAVGYDYSTHPTLRKAVEEFNFSHPTHGKHTLHTHGAYASLAYGQRLGDNRFFLTPRIGYWFTRSRTQSFVYPLQSVTMGLEAELGLDIYPFSSGDNTAPLSFSRNFHVNVHAGATYMFHQLFLEGEALRVNEERYFPTAIAPFAGLGLGFDFFSLPVFSFTPEIRAGYIFPFGFDDLHLAYSGGSNLAPEIGKSGRIYLQVGVAFRLHALRTTYR